MNNGRVVEYFDYNGIRYRAGTLFKCKNFMAPKYGDVIYVTFKEKNVNTNFCLIALNNGNMMPQMFMYPLETLVNNIIEAVNIPKGKTVTDNKENGYYYWTEDGEQYGSKIPNDVWNGLVWYIIVMVGSLIFKEFYLIWIMASIIFWPWAKNKVKGGQ